MSNMLDLLLGAKPGSKGLAGAYAMPSKAPKARPALMRVSEIRIPKKDYPDSGQYPPCSGPFTELIKSLKRWGMLVPVFVDNNHLLLQGHYRFWAWQHLGNKHVPVVVVESAKDIREYFD